MKEGGFRLAPGPGHGHLRSAVSGLNGNAVFGSSNKAVSGLRLDLDMGIY
jgi:hypothetical protein